MWAHHASRLTACRTRHKSRTGGNLPHVLDCYYQKKQCGIGFQPIGSPWTQHLEKGLCAPLFFDFWSLLQVSQVVVRALPLDQQLLVVSMHWSCALVTSTHSFHIPDPLWILSAAARIIPSPGLVGGWRGRWPLFQSQHYSVLPTWALNTEVLCKMPKWLPDLT